MLTAVEQTGKMGAALLKPTGEPALSVPGSCQHKLGLTDLLQPHCMASCLLPRGRGSALHHGCHWRQAH
jgi:hypothetical protein